MTEIKITRGTDYDNCRYHYDCGQCSVKKGWAQVDTPEDAYYFGIWAQPVKLQIFSYIEGDTTLCEYPDVSTFVAALRTTLFADVPPNARRIYRVDPFRQSLAEEFIRRGAADCLYPSFLSGEEP